MLIALLPVAVIGAAGAAVIWIAAPDLAHVFLHGLRHGGGTVDIRIIAPLVPLGALSACLIDGARGFGRTWPYLTIEGLGKPLARIALVLGVLLAGLGLHGAIIAWGIPVGAAPWPVASPSPSSSDQRSRCGRASGRPAAPQPPARRLAASQAPHRTTPRYARPAAPQGHRAADWSTNGAGS